MSNEFGVFANDYPQYSWSGYEEDLSVYLGNNSLANEFYELLPSGGIAHMGDAVKIIEWLRDHGWECPV